ncbi:MAG: hypothetical protein GYA24_13045 [Candidatus Lokiarchaeota archaeon]|nr:hypothetical protein [Candidatus Lokiarchaeota archaeon]
MNPYCDVDPGALTVEKDGKAWPLVPLTGQSCPALLYVAIPYLMAMRNGVRFPWEKDDNAVKVTCPAGHVDFELRKDRGGGFRITVLHQDGKCRKHAVNEAIPFSIKPDDAAIFNEIFLFSFMVSDGNKIILPGNVIVSRKDAGNKQDARENTACDARADLEKANICLHVEGMKRSCAFHRSIKARPIEQLVPRGLCPLAYHAAYPTLLDLIYANESREAVPMYCPGTHARVKFIVERKKRWIKPFLDILDFFLSRTPVRLDIIKYRVLLKVMSIDGTCTQHLKTGDRFLLRDSQCLCPSSFYSLFPAMLSRSRGNSSSPCTCTCTSVPCHVTYKIQGIPIKDS